jgi:outer membrane protein insertion porin family
MAWRFLCLILCLGTFPARAQENPIAESAVEFEGVTVHRVFWTGNNVTRDHVIARELATREGEPFRVKALLADYVRLENLGVFAKIEIATALVEDGVEVEFRLVEMPSYIPYLAFRYTEENGWSVGPALSSVNLFGRVITLSGRALFGGTTTLLMDFAYPWITGNHVSLTARAAYLTRQDEVRDFEETSWELMPWIGKFLGKHGRVAGALGWFQMNSDKDGITLSENHRDDLFRLGLRLGYDTRDSWRVPGRGWQNEVELLRTGGILGGDGDFFTFTADIRRYQPVWDQTLALVLLTSLQTGEAGSDVPSYMQYTMGGANTIRGYDFLELGRQIFGKNQLIGTLEYQYMVVPLRHLKIFRWSFSAGLQAAAFADVGTAWDTSEQFTASRFRAGYGLGLRLIIPQTEMVRFDVGFSEAGVEFHFGTWTKFTAQRLRLR